MRLATTDFFWLIRLLTASRARACDLTVESSALEGDAGAYFSTWMRAWSRRVAIAKALAVIRHDLKASARRTKSMRFTEAPVLAPEWTLHPDTAKTDLERALLSIDVFPRAALLLSVFEETAIPDAAVLLDANPELVKKAQAVGLRQLTSNLARMQRTLKAA
jgi:DNA-directed RNA polymerase specialized sigma24 family protein